jgi:hypothetical protein
MQDKQGQTGTDKGFDKNTGGQGQTETGKQGGVQQPDLGKSGQGSGQGSTPER